MPPRCDCGQPVIQCFPKPCRFSSQGWPLKFEADDLKALICKRREELSVHAGCVLCGSRIVIPHKGPEDALDVLHESHPGTVRMKSLATSYVWWPNMAKPLEEKDKSCVPWQSHQKNPPRSPLHPWEWPGRSWSQAHVDYAGPFMGKMSPPIIDANSKWMHVYPLCEFRHNQHVPPLIHMVYQRF